MKKTSQKALCIVLMLCMVMSAMVFNVSAVDDERGNTIVNIPVGKVTYSFAWEPEEKNIMNDYFGDTTTFSLDFLRLSTLLNYQTCFLYYNQLDGILAQMGFNETEYNKNNTYDGKYYDEYTFMTELGYYKDVNGNYTDADGNLIYNDKGELYTDKDVTFDWNTWTSNDKRVLMPDETTFFILASCDVKVGKVTKTIILVLFGASETTGRGLTSLDFFSSDDYTCLNYAKTSAQVVIDNPDFQKLVKDAVDDKDIDDFILWTGGYCRGGACGNYLAAHLNKCTDKVTNVDGTVNPNYVTDNGRQVKFGQSRIKAVDNESMNVTQNPDHTMTNIVNIINPEDLITYLPLGEGYEGWGFGRNGVDLILHTELTNPDMFLEVQDTYNNMSSMNDYSNLGIGIQGLYDALDSIYTMCPQPSDFSTKEQLMYKISNLDALTGNTEIGTSGTGTPSAGDITNLLNSVQLKPYYTTLNNLMTYMFLQTNGSLGVDSEITQVLIGTVIKKDIPLLNVLPGIDQLLPIIGTAENPESEARPLMLFVIDNATEYTIPELLINIIVEYRKNQTLPTLGTSGKMFSAHMIEASLSWILTGDTMDDIFQNEGVAEISELDTAMYALNHVFVFIKGLLTDIGGNEEETDPDAPFVYEYENAYLTVSNENILTGLGVTINGIETGVTDMWGYNNPKMKAHIKVSAANNPSIVIYEGTLTGSVAFDYSTYTASGMTFSYSGVNTKLNNYNKTLAYKFEVYIEKYSYNGVTHNPETSKGFTYAAPVKGTPYVTVEGKDVTLNLNGAKALRFPYISQSNSSSSNRRSSFFMMLFNNNFTPIILEGDTGIGTTTVTGTGNYNISVYGTTSTILQPSLPFQPPRMKTQTWNLSAYVGG